jgi:DNA-binding IscR family transcriptional regulator
VLRVYHLLVKKFAAGEKPLTLPEIANSLKIPVSFVREILSDLSSKGLVVEIVKGIRKEASFQPGRAIEEITVKEVLDAYERGEDTGFASKQSDESAEKLSLYIKTLYEAMEKSPGNVKLKDV